MGGWRRAGRAKVVVGVTGSAGSRAAVEFAVHEAALRDASLLALMAVRDPRERRGTVSTGLIESAEHELRTILESAGTGTVDADLIVTTTPAADALLDQSRDAALLVLGAPDDGVLAASSVPLRCLQDADCPVVVVRVPRRASHGDPDRRHPRDNVARFLG